MISDPNLISIDISIYNHNDGVSNQIDNFTPHIISTNNPSENDIINIIPNDESVSEINSYNSSKKIILKLKELYIRTFRYRR